MDISNGEGVGVSLFVQGCDRHCKNCFNAETWDFDGGKEWGKIIEDEFIELCKQDFVTHVSILGGEPLQQDGELYSLLNRIKQEVKKPIWLWTGYRYSELHSLYPDKFEVVKLCDVLVDGEFIQELADINLKWRGSSNQKVWRKNFDVFREE